MYKDKEQKRQYNKRYYLDSKRFAIEHHLCTNCYKESAYGSGHTCLLCRAESAKRSQEIRNSMTEEQRKKRSKENVEYKRKVANERKEKGICTECGERKSINGRVRCGICLEKDRERHRLRKVLSNEDKTKNRQYRLKNHLCYNCGIPLDKNNKNTVCDKCSEIFSEAGKKGKIIAKMKYPNLNKCSFVKKIEKEIIKMEQITKTTFKELCEECFKQHIENSYKRYNRCPKCIYKNECKVPIKEACFMNNEIISPCNNYCKYKKTCLNSFKEFLKRNQENITNDLLYDLSSFQPMSFINKEGKFLFNEELGNEVLELKED